MIILKDLSITENEEMSSNISNNVADAVEEVY